MSSPRRIVSSDWTPASKIYKNPSFARIASEAFKSIRAIRPYHDRVVFQQTVGARTVSPEVIGETAGDVAGVVVSPIATPIAEKIGALRPMKFRDFRPFGPRLS